MKTFISTSVPPARAQEEEARLLRFPTIHGDNVVFSYAGNLYTVPAKGGVARRLGGRDLVLPDDHPADVVANAPSQLRDQSNLKRHLAQLPHPHPPTLQ